MSDSQEHFGFGEFAAGVILFGGIGLWLGGWIGFIIGLVITISVIIIKNKEVRDIKSFNIAVREFARNLINWIAHLCFLFFGIALILYSLVIIPVLSNLFGFIFGGSFFIAASLFFLPPLRRKAFSVTNRAISTKARAILVFCLSVAGLVALVPHVPEILEHEREVAAQQREIARQRTEQERRAAEQEQRAAERERRATEQAAEQERRAEERERRIQSQFSIWNGSHRNLEREIKGSMNDPRSYRHVRTEWSVEGNDVTVRTTFRGRNAFGGTITTTVEALVDLDGNVIRIDGF